MFPAYQANPQNCARPVRVVPPLKNQHTDQTSLPCISHRCRAYAALPYYLRSYSCLSFESIVDLQQNKIRMVTINKPRA